MQICAALGLDLVGKRDAGHLHITGKRSNVNCCHDDLCNRGAVQTTVPSLTGSSSTHATGEVPSTVLLILIEAKVDILMYISHAHILMNTLLLIVLLQHRTVV